MTYFYDMQSLSEFENPDFSRIGIYVSDSIQRHTSYLKGPQVIFALFDEMAAPVERSKIASSLAAIPRPDTSPFYFKAGKLSDIPLECSMQECVGSSLLSNDVGDFYSKKTLAVLV